MPYFSPETMLSFSFLSSLLPSPPPSSSPSPIAPRSSLLALHDRYPPPPPPPLSPPGGLRMTLGADVTITPVAQQDYLDHDQEEKALDLSGGARGYKASSPLLITCNLPLATHSLLNHSLFDM